MTSTTADNALYRIYRRRIGEPTTHDEVRGYWVFLVGLVLGTLGILLFLPSTSAVGAGGFTLRELSIFLAAVGLAMLVAGPVIRLPLQPWANYAAYIGQVVCFAAAVWFLLVFPAGWSVQAGSQPVIVLYGIGLAVVTLGGVVAPLLAGAAREDAREGGAATAELQSRLDSLWASQAQFELYQDRGEEWRWRLRHRNGNVIADGGEGYTRKHNARKGMQSVRRNALGATLLEILPEPETDPEDALAAAPLLPDLADESQAGFEVYEDEAAEWRWRLVHENGNVLADSGEGYVSRQGARDAVERTQASVGPASYLQFDPASFEVYRDAAGQWRWRLVHRNGNVVAAASEGYTRRRDAKRSVDSVRDLVADGDAFEVYEDEAGEHRWRLRAGNREVVATSGEGYGTASGARDAVERVQQFAPDADALDVGLAAFEVYEDGNEEWRWRLRHRNGNVLADGGEGYASRRGLHEAIESVKRNAPGADVEA
ncbi:MAG: HVO_2922 family protein [Halorientalis sp.]